MRKVSRSLTALTLIGGTAVLTVRAAEAGATSVAVGYGSAGWSYREVAPGAAPGFEQAGYPPGVNWPTARAGFGSTGSTCEWNTADRVHTAWTPGTDLLLRRTVTRPAGAELHILGTIDNDADVYVNGTLAQHVENGSCTADGIAVSLPAARVNGSDVVAVRAADTGDERFADLKITYTTGGGR